MIPSTYYHRMGRIASFASLFSSLILLGGCHRLAGIDNKPTTSMKPIVPTFAIVEASPDDPTIKQLKSIPMCVYTFDPGTNDIMRLSLDGSRMETVMKIGTSYRFNPTLNVGTNHYPNASGESLVSCIPNENGICYLDVSATHPAGWYIKEYQDTGCTTPSRYSPVVTKPVLYQDSSKPSPWKIRFDVDLVQLDPSHYHTKLACVTFEDAAGHKAVLKGAPDLVGFFSPGIAIIHVEKDLYAWDLLKDHKILIGHALKAHIWDRNLNQPKRYTPIDMSGHPTGPTTTSRDYVPNIKKERERLEKMRARRPGGL